MTSRQPGGSSGAAGGNADRDRSGDLSVRFRERRLVLIALDLLAVNAALLLAVVLRPEHGGGWELLLRHPLWFITASAVWLPMAYAFDAYAPTTTERPGAAMRAVLLAGLLAAGVYLLIPYITPPLPARRIELAALPVLVVVFLSIGRGLYLLLLRHPRFQRVTLVVGTGSAGVAVTEAVVRRGADAYRIAGFVDDDPASHGRVLDVGGHEMRVLGDLRHQSPWLDIVILLKTFAEVARLRGR